MSLETYISVILVFVALFYLVTILSLVAGMTRIRTIKSANQPFVSVIVAARNEESNLDQLLSALIDQDYASYEIIVANDRSTDRTGEILRNFQKTAANLKTVEIRDIPSSLPPKKNALAEAIKVSRGELLCFTDADCLPRREWVSELVSCFTPEVGLVAGYSPYDVSSSTRGGVGRAVLTKFVAYEELKAAAWSAGSIGLAKGWLCTGRNLAFRRKVYDEVGGYDAIRHSVSGDDDLFLQLVRRKTQWKISYAFSSNSFVATAPPHSFPEFIEQRKRHFSAARYFPLSLKAFFAVFHGSNLILFLGFLAFFSTTHAFLLGLPAFVLKLLADVTLFFFASATFRQRGFGSYFLLMEILYIFYNTFVGPLGLIRKFEWKPEPTT